MCSTTRQKTKKNGVKVPILPGLAGDVHKILEGIPSVQSVMVGKIRMARGDQKVKLNWGNGPFLVTVYDRDRGERQLTVMTKRHGAVSRLLRKELKRMGVYSAPARNQSQRAA